MTSGISIRNEVGINPNDLDLDSSVPDWLIEYPQLLPLFQEWGIEYCCGGKSLRTACLEKNLSLRDVSSQMTQLLKLSKTTATDAGA